MSGIQAGVFLTVCQITVDLRDDLGNLRSVLGTGFWVKDGETSYFVTNRHNVDPKLKLGTNTTYRAVTLKIQLREQSSPGSWEAATDFVIVANLDSSLRWHRDADVAVLKNPALPSSHEGLGHGSVDREELANESFFAESLSPMDIASFVGFPGKNGKAWWDEQWQFPIARTVNIASWPRIPFTNASIPTADVILVSGLSFSGSSGSPVFSHQKGTKVSGPLTGGNYVQPKVVGIMSGHWWNEEPSDGMFYHSGLSYFTRSTSILELFAI